MTNEMTYEQILYDVSEGIATVTLNRPEKLNAWTLKMGHEVEHAITSADADEAVRVIVITGAGRGFCAGADLSLLSGATEKVDASEVKATSATPFNVYLPKTKKPLIAAINGPAVGMGFVFPLYCDIRFASANAKLSSVFAKLGLIAEYGSAWILPRLVGVARSFDILYSARSIEAGEALAMGLVNAVFAADTFEAEVRKYALNLARNMAPSSLITMRRQVYGALTQTQAEEATIAESEMYASLTRADFREGYTAFAQRRQPHFTGR